jgi:hypothetical protein
MLNYSTTTSLDPLSNSLLIPILLLNDVQSEAGGGGGQLRHLPLSHAFFRNIKIGKRMTYKILTTRIKRIKNIPLSRILCVIQGKLS